MISLELEKGVERAVVGVFPRTDQLDQAQRSLQLRGIAPDQFGRLVKHSDRKRGEHSIGDNMLSVIAPRGWQSEIVKVMREAGAVTVGTLDEVEAEFGEAPHPGMIEDHDMKLPAGREYPETMWPPAISGHKVRPAALDERLRVTNFDEVELGYVEIEALEEANRCLQCIEPRCVQGCPAHNDIPNFIRAIKRGDLRAGMSVLRRTTNLPGVCSRVCDQSKQCEGACVLATEGGDAVGIGLLERYLADWELKEGLRRRQAEARAPRTGKRVAVIGSGPSGLTVVGDLAHHGHDVTVYEALPVAGGALAWGIPEFRLPPAVLQNEIDFLTALGVEFRLGIKVGVDVTVDDLFVQGYDAVFVGAGAMVPTGLGVPGEDLDGIYTATEFLSRAKLSRTHPHSGYEAPLIGERLAVIGAGNTAMDVAQTALRLSLGPGPRSKEEEHTAMDVAETARRLGFREVTVVYRRSEEEMPARRDEVEGAREEGTRFKFLTTPTRFIGNDYGRVVAMECMEVELGRPDRRGRREPVLKSGSNFVMPVDTVVMALGYRPDPLIAKTTSSLETDRSGLVVANRSTGRTGRRGIWCAGDLVSGPDTVVRAMAAGKQVARDIDRYLQGGVWSRVW